MGKNTNNKAKANGAKKGGQQKPAQQPTHEPQTPEAAESQADAAVATAEAPPVSPPSQGPPPFTPPAGSPTPEQPAATPSPPQTPVPVETPAVTPPTPLVEHVTNYGAGETVVVPDGHVAIMVPVDLSSLHLFATRHVDVNALNPEQTAGLRALYSGLDERRIKLGGGESIHRPTGAVRWLLEQIAKGCNAVELRKKSIAEAESRARSTSKN